MQAGDYVKSVTQGCGRQKDKVEGKALGAPRRTALPLVRTERKKERSEAELSPMLPGGTRKVTVCLK